jgi:fibronectin type 3 domain-containing protein
MPRGTDILVTWTRPSRNQDNSLQTNLQEFRLFRAVSPPIVAGAAAQPVFVLLATVRADRPENAVVQGTVYAYRDESVTAGLTYRYQVQAVNRGGEASPLSEEAIADLTSAPATPVNLRATGRDGVVELEWQAPPAAGQEPTPPARGYNVYRALQPGAYGTQPINARPLSETAFRDAGVSNDVTYYYVVRSVGTDRPPWRESVDSVEVSVVSQDFVAPAPPRGLIAIPDQGAVALTWDANTEPDILGYFVYRRELPQVVPVRLTAAPVPGTTFTDRTPRSGASYVYTVTAVDRSSHRNESAPSAEVQVTLP